MNKHIAYTHFKLFLISSLLDQTLKEHPTSELQVKYLRMISGALFCKLVTTTGLQCVQEKVKIPRGAHD